ncbi:unnamed protein product, partial [Staurois parvus]
MTRDRRLADAQQQAASREVGDLRTLSSRQLPGPQRSADRAASQGPSDQQTGRLPRAPAISRQGGFPGPQRSADRAASQGPSDQQTGRLPRAPAISRQGGFPGPQRSADRAASQ